MLHVNRVEVTVRNTKTQEILYRNAFVTDFPLDRASVPLIVQAGRARWKVENENNNVLKTKSYHLEHNYGHGKQFLSTLNFPDFPAHSFLETVDSKYKTVRKVPVARKTFFHDFTTLTKYLFFDSWNHLMNRHPAKLLELTKQEFSDIHNPTCHLQRLIFQI